MRLPLPLASLVAALLLPASCLLTGCGKPAQRPASVLTEPDRAFLEGYEKVRVALAGDNLSAAKRAADTLASASKPAASPGAKPSDAYVAARLVADAVTLDSARENFKILSALAIRRAGDVTGYYVMTSPIAPGGDWLQASAKVDNPYLGRATRSFGQIKK